eukprot:5908773-Ditylum_brightwellii.AAC.1
MNKSTGELREKPRELKELKKPADEPNKKPNNEPKQEKIREKMWNLVRFKKQINVKEHLDK